MKIADVLLDGYSRVRDAVEDVLSDVSSNVLGEQPDPGSNSIAWLVWHLTRVQDDHFAAAFLGEQVWHREGFVALSLPFSPGATGYGQTSEDVAALSSARRDLLIEYFHLVDEQTTRYLTGLSDDAFERIVDHFGGGPISLGVRLVSVLDDDLEHVGAAAYLKGVLERRAS